MIEKNNLRRIIQNQWYEWRFVQGYTGNEFSDLGLFFCFPAPLGQPTDYVIRHIIIKGNFT